MKKVIFIIMSAIITIGNYKAKAQATEVVQLLLNVEKLAQLKSILSDLKKGYDIVHGGYSTIKDLSEGNFSLHKTFLDALMQASPVVKKYYKVGKIIEYQVVLIKEYKTAFNRFKQSNLLRPAEISYIGSVYANLLNLSLRNLEELANVVTSGKLRMNDEERLKAIDGIFLEMEEKLSFLKSFNRSTSMLTLQRGKEKQDALQMQQIYNLK
ncbi:TerB family tellurite resistance protein [Sphingobacterium detergens]|uniref:TerB family tellurite resistance protein n=1 Tax=Sphingobacterium detergens TaxID=1145106 RepID=A0A420ART6_SPHD1|nr:TerB family tellurite resistance protein [Sphingobacterium detergens]RKE47178.1 hypothetical protein DFQ12_4342 [Sphingobacterium detergens]